MDRCEERRELCNEFEASCVESLSRFEDGGGSEDIGRLRLVGSSRRRGWVVVVMGNGNWVWRPLGLSGGEEEKVEVSRLWAERRTTPVLGGKAGRREELPTRVAVRPSWRSC